MEKRKYAKVVSIRKLWYMFLCNFCFWKWTLSLFYLRLIKKVLKLCKTLHYLDFDGRKRISFWVSCYLCSTFLFYFKQKFKSVNMVFSCDYTSTFCFSNSLVKFFMARYRIGIVIIPLDHEHHHVSLADNCCTTDSYLT